MGRIQRWSYRMSFVTFNEVYKVLLQSHCSTPELNWRRKRTGKIDTACNTVLWPECFHLYLHKVEIYFGFSFFTRTFKNMAQWLHSLQPSSNLWQKKQKLGLQRKMRNMHAKKIHCELTLRTSRTKHFMKHKMFTCWMEPMQINIQLFLVTNVQ